MSAKVIELADRRAKRYPDDDLMDVDEHGRLLYTFTVKFRHEGEDHAFDLMAHDEVEAEAMIRSMNHGILVFGGKVWSRQG